ncbi:MAG: hypothetical protein EOO40_07890, partial [Deltaproteobacteria bacterium]
MAAPPPPPAATEAQEAAAQALDEEAERLQKLGQVAQSARKREQLLSKYPTTGAAARLLQKRAKAAAAAGQSREAVVLYERLLLARPAMAEDLQIRRAYALLLLESGRFADAAVVLDQLLEHASGRQDSLALGTALGDAYSSMGRTLEAVTLLMRLQTLGGLRPEELGALQQRAIGYVTQNLGAGEAQTLWENSRSMADWAFLQPVLAYKLAKVYYHVRDYERSEQMLNLVAERFGDSPFADDAAQFLQLLKSRFEVDPKAIGVLLPLSGRYKLYGERVQKAMELGIGGHTNFKLIFKDTQGEPTVAAQAVETLVLQEHVIGLVGPLFSGEAMAVAHKAEELAVPLVSLSHREGLPQLGPYVFRAALTVEAQAQALAKVAFETLGFSRFAMLYPRSRYGIDFMTAFWDEVDRRHGEMRGIEAYEPDQTTFKEPVRRLVGRHYLTLRADFKA